MRAIISRSQKSQRNLPWLCITRGYTGADSGGLTWAGLLVEWPRDTTKNKTK